MNSVDDINTPTECILPKCRNSEYKYASYKKKLNDGTFKCSNELNCISDGGIIDYNIKEDNNGSKIDCIFANKDLTDLSEYQGCKNPYTPNIFIMPKGDMNCLNYLKSDDRDCEISSSYEIVGKCGSDLPNKQRYEKLIKRFNSGNGKWCPPLRDRIKYEDCDPTKDKNTQDSQVTMDKKADPKTYVYIVIILMLIILFIYFFVKKFVL
jgi:hypothetical protein